MPPAPKAFLWYNYAGTPASSGTHLTEMKKSLGHFVVVDAEICHGQPVFDGTRIFVRDVLSDVSRGLNWDAIIERWHGAITKEAIAEAVELASEALSTHAGSLAGHSAVS